MVIIAAFGHRNPGSNPGWFAVSNSNQNWVFNTGIIQAYNRGMWLPVMPVVITLTVSNLASGDK